MSEARASTTATPSQASTVLIIDDSQTIRTVAQMALASAGYRVTCAENAADGVRAASAEPPDLVLLDYLLPDHTGDEVCAALAADPRTATCRILVLSAKGDELRGKAASWPGVVGVMSKPFTAAVLVARVAELLGSGDGGWTFAEQNAVAQAIFQVLRPGLRQVPDWERQRGTAQASTWFAGRLLSPAAIAGLMTAIVPVMTSVIGRRATAEAAALSGSLRDFPLFDLLGFLHTGRRSGRVELEVDGERSVVHLDQGRVIGVAAPPERDRAAVRAAWPEVDSTMLAQLVGDPVAAASGLPLVAHLTHDPARRSTALRATSEAELERLWQATGTFTVRLGTPPDELVRLGVAIDPAQIALRRLRQIEDLSQLESLAGRLDTVFQRQPSGNALLARLSLLDAERRVLALIDGQRDVATIAATAGQGLMTVLAVLFRFVQLGVLTPLTATAAPRHALLVIAPGASDLAPALLQAWQGRHGTARTLESAACLGAALTEPPALAVVEVDGDDDPAPLARRLRERWGTGVPLIAIDPRQRTATPWAYAFDGLLVPPLHLDDLTAYLPRT